MSGVAFTEDVAREVLVAHVAGGNVEATAVSMRQGDHDGGRRGLALVLALGGGREGWTGEGAMCACV